MIGPLRRWRSTSADNGEEIGSAQHERLMLLQLASELESLPVRNIVYRSALDDVAHEIVRLAQSKLTEPS